MELIPMRMPMLRQKDDAAAPPHADDVVSLDRDLTFMDEPAAPAMVLQLGDILILAGNKHAIDHWLETL